MSTDLKLLESWRGGDIKAGDQLFELYFEQIARFFQNKLPEAWPDLVQQTFMACVEGRERIRSTSSFRSYLFGIAHNQLRKFLRNRYRQGREIDFEEASMHDLEPGPLQMVMERREERLLLQALRDIPVDHQVLLELRYWEDMTSREISEVLGIKHSTLRTRIQRARELLRQALERHAASVAILASTMDNIEAWVLRCRSQLMADAESLLHAGARPEQVVERSFERSFERSLGESLRESSGLSPGQPPG